MISIPPAPDVPGFDAAVVATVVDAAMGIRGGADLVIGSLGSVPGAVVTERRSGFLRSSEGGVQLAQWRFEGRSGGRLAVSHVVGGIALSDEMLPTPQVGGHVAAALAQHLVEYGPQILPDVVAVLAGLRVATK